MAADWLLLRQVGNNGVNDFNWIYLSKVCSEILPN